MVILYFFGGEEATIKMSRQRTARVVGSLAGLIPNHRILQETLDFTDPKRNITRIFALLLPLNAPFEEGTTKVFPKKSVQFSMIIRNAGVFALLILF